MRRPVVIVLASLALSLGFIAAIGLLTDPPNTPRDPRPAGEVPMATLPGANSSFWPYLSTRPDFEKRSPVNVIVLGATVDRVVALMRETGWNHTLPEQGDADEGQYSFADTSGGTAVAWGETTGASRYAYLDDGSGAAWRAQTHQVHDGTYFGHRFHVRLYDSPIPGDWVILQAHSEHFDWFTLRHAVDGVASGQRHVEADFMDQPFVREIWRMHLGNAVSDGDGWASVIELAALAMPVLAGSLAARKRPDERLVADLHTWLTAGRERLTLDHALLGLAVAGLVLGVRSGGLLLEAHADALTPHVIATALYPVLVAGVPLAAFAIAHRIQRRIDAAVVASLALGAASLLDYALLGVDVLPIKIVLHRVGLVFAIGLIAAGGTRRATRAHHLNGLIVAGATTWLALVAATLFGWW